MEEAAVRRLLCFTVAKQERIIRNIIPGARIRLHKIHDRTRAAERIDAGGGGAVGFGVTPCHKDAGRHTRLALFRIGIRRAALVKQKDGT